MNEKQQKPHSVFAFGFRPTVSIYSVSAKNFHFGASLDRTAIFILFTFCLFLLFKLSFIYFIRDQFLFFYCTCSNVSSLTLLPSVVFRCGLCLPQCLLCSVRTCPWFTVSWPSTTQRSSTLCCTRSIPTAQGNPLLHTHSLKQMRHYT